MKGTQIIVTYSMSGNTSLEKLPSTEGKYPHWWTYISVVFGGSSPSKGDTDSQTTVIGSFWKTIHDVYLYLRSPVIKPGLIYSENIKESNRFFDDETIVPSFDWRSYLARNEEIGRLYDGLFSKCEDPWVQVTEIEPDIFLGGIPNPVSDPPNDKIFDGHKAPHIILSDFEIRTIISFSDYRVWWNIDDDFSYDHFVLADYANQRIYKCFYRVISTINRARSRGEKIFIHCHMGYSRSVTVLMAYYLHSGIPNNKTPTLTQVVKFVQSKRPFVCPNIGFFAQLAEYEIQLNNTRTSQKMKN